MTDASKRQNMYQWA